MARIIGNTTIYCVMNVTAGDKLCYHLILKGYAVPLQSRQTSHKGRGRKQFTRSTHTAFEGRQ